MFPWSQGVSAAIPCHTQLTPLSSLPYYLYSFLSFSSFSFFLSSSFFLPFSSFISSYSSFFSSLSSFPLVILSSSSLRSQLKRRFGVSNISLHANIATHLGTTSCPSQACHLSQPWCLLGKTEFCSAHVVRISCSPGQWLGFVGHVV